VVIRKDFYDSHDRFTATNKERNKYQQMIADLEVKEREALARALKENKNYYIMNFSNLGGLVMPILLELTYKNGKTENQTIPAEIWRRSPKHVSKLLVTDKELKSVVIDTGWDTADVDVENNHYPRQIILSRIEAFKKKDKEKPEYRDIMHNIKKKVEEPKRKVKKK